MTAVIKNILLTLLGLTMTVSCTQKKSLSSVEEWLSDNGKIKVLSTIAQIGDRGSAVGGDRIDSLVLVPGEMGPHSYELVKGDAEKFSRADVILYNGLGLEHGASLFAILKSSPKAVPIGDEVR